MNNKLKCTLHHPEFGTVEVNGVSTFCKGYSYKNVWDYRDLVKGLKDKVNGWTLVEVESKEEDDTKPRTKTHSNKDYTYNAGIITPNDTKIKPFQTLFVGEDEFGLTSYHDHIPVFAADKNSLYKRFIALFTLNFSSYKGLGYRSNLQDDTKVIDFWEQFLEDLNKYVSPRQLFKYHTTFYNLPLNLKHSLYETALVLYRLEHENEE
ncbi:hypothetical protein O1C12_003439 [Vibrio cholerae]|nr:hypothetical protein [Vibrio cholerae]